MPKKTILLTGASSGFGVRAIEPLLKNGHRIIAGIRGGLDRFKDMELGDLHPYLDDKDLFIADLHMERPETFAVAEQIIQEHFDNRLDVLINNAGFGLSGPVELVSEESLRNQFDVNFFGPFTLTQTLLPYIKPHRGRIINVSSIVGKTTFPLQGPYCASKHALESYTEALYYDMQHFQVQVCLVEPGAFRTNFIRDMRHASVETGKYPKYQAMMEDFSEFTHNRAQSMGARPEKVVKLLVKLTEKEKIPLRVLVGTDAKILSFFLKIFPANFKVKLFHWIYRRLVFR